MRDDIFIHFAGKYFYLFRRKIFLFISQVCFIRVSRPATPVVYANDEPFAIGKAKILRKSDADQVLVVAAGVTLHEALKAADTLAEAGVHVRVMDPFTIKPLDIQAVQDNAAACNGRVITVEDHYPEVSEMCFALKIFH